MDSPRVRRDADRIWVDGVDRYRVVEPTFEAVRIVLAHRGERYSAAYMQGISGAAFRIAGICPCAPTCSLAMEPKALIERLGYDVTVISPLQAAQLPPGDSDGAFVKLMQGETLPPAGALTTSESQRIAAEAVKMNEAIKSQIRAGRPVIVWHAFTNAEYDVVFGYDDATGQFLGRGSYTGNDGESARAGQYRCMRSVEIGGWPTAILICQRVREFHAAHAEISALREAVRHARSLDNLDKADGEQWVMLQGIAAYDRWVADWSKPDKKRQIGDSYCWGIYRSTHRAAGEFLREIAPRHPAMSVRLLAAADHFEVEADALDEAHDLLGWQAPTDPDARRNARVAAILARARDAYAAGIIQLEQALTAQASP